MSKAHIARSELEYKLLDTQAVVSHGYKYILLGELIPSSFGWQSYSTCTLFFLFLISLSRSLFFTAYS